MSPTPMVPAPRPMIRPSPLGIAHFVGAPVLHKGAGAYVMAIGQETHGRVHEEQNGALGASDRLRAALPFLCLACLGAQGYLGEDLHCKFQIPIELSTKKIKSNKNAEHIYTI